MKNLTISRRLTIFYSIILFVFLLTMETTLYLIHEYVDDANTKLSLSTAVLNSVDEINYENDVISLDNSFQTYVGGSVLCVFNEEGVRLKGNLPSSFSSLSFKEGKYQLVQVKREEYLVYDHRIEFSENKSLWIRGVALKGDRTSIMTSSLRILAIIFPIFLIIILWVGYFMTKRTLRPIVDISEDISSIREVDDLSKRLKVGNEEDELSHLSSQINEMLEKLELSIAHEKQFYGDVSHELKTPIAIMRLECETLMEKEDKEEIERIHEQVVKMGRIVNQMILLSRTHHDLQKEELDLSLLFESEVEQMRELAKKKDIIIDSHIEEGITYLGDEVLLMRMLMNLLDNAIKYNNQNGRIKVELYQDEKINLLVEDNGIGMNEEELSHFFDRFYRGKGRYLSEGTGMGMAIVKWIIESHKGTIDVKSEVGKGTKITVKL